MVRYLQLQHSVPVLVLLRCHSHWIPIGFDLKIAAWGYMLHIRTVPTLHGNVGAVARLLHPSRVHGVRGLTGGCVCYYCIQRMATKSHAWALHIIGGFRILSQDRSQLFNLKPGPGGKKAG